MMTEALIEHKILGRLRYWLLASAVLVYLVIVAGSIVRATGSGLACPDWPTCNGSWLPPMSFDGLIVYAHRLVTILLAPVAIVVAAIVFRSFRQTQLIARPVLWSLVLIGLQAVLGAFVVGLDLAGWIVALHLGLSLVILALLLVAGVMAFVRHFDPDQADRPQVPEPLCAFIDSFYGIALSSTGQWRLCIWQQCRGSLPRLALVQWSIFTGDFAGLGERHSPC